MLNKDTKKAEIDTSIRLIANVVLNLMIIEKITRSVNQRVIDMIDLNKVMH